MSETQRINQSGPQHAPAPSARPVWTLLLVVLSLAMTFALPAGPAHAQKSTTPAPPAPPPAAEDFSPADPLRPVRPVRPANTARAIPGLSSEIQIQVVQFGIGSTARPGDWIGVQIQLQDQTDRPRNVVVRLAIPDADGDTAEQERAVVSNPGVRQPVWLYTRLPFSAGRGDTFTITAHEAIEQPGPAGSAVAYTPGRVLGQTVYPSGQLASPYAALTAIVGRRAAGMDQFFTSHFPQTDYSPFGHELLEGAIGLSPDQLPDRWMGLAGFESLIWTGAGAEDAPSRLSEAQAQSIREWVRRGGHLVVVLPVVAQGWIGSTANPLADLMPAVTVDRFEGADLGRYRSLLTRSVDAQLPRDSTVQTFTPDPNAPLAAAIPLMDGPDGETVVVRRLVGIGMVTVIGLDLTSRGLTDVAEAFRADQFWNRVLGKRMRLEPPSVLDKVRTATNVSLLQGSRPPDELDLLISTVVAKSAQAARGLLLAFLVFLAYWLLAGPLGFFLLGRRNLRQHAWVAFLGCALLFTIIGWGGANLLKVRGVQGRHLTFLDQVYGQPNQRMRTWVNLLLPQYGEPRVSVGGAAGSTEFDWHQTLSAWDAPTGTGINTFSAFPDARGYAVETRAPSSANIPARATVKQLQIDFAGSAPINWELIHPVVTDAKQTPLGSEIRLVESTPGSGGSGAGGARSGGVLVGQLVHKLPGTLRDVQILLVREPLRSNFSIINAPEAWLPMTGEAAWVAEWLPGQVLELDKVFQDRAARVSGLSALMSQLRGQPASDTLGGLPPALSTRDLPKTLTALSLFSMLGPPDVTGANRATLLRRQATHTLDLGKYFTQPCLILIGILGDDTTLAECPTPISVDDATPDELRPRITGRTVVRWVYPLPARPLRATVLTAPTSSPPSSPSTQSSNDEPR